MSYADHGRTSRHSRAYLLPHHFRAPIALWVVGVLAGLHSAQGVDPDPNAQHPFPSELLSAVFSYRATGLSPNLGQSMYWSPGSSILRMRWSERDPEDPERWYETEVEESSSFRMSAVGSREGGNDVLLAGLEDDGSIVVERWTYAPRPGGYYISGSAPSTGGIGVPQPSFVPSEHIDGAAFVAPVSRSHDPARRRVRLYEGVTIGLPRSIAVDPQGRFVLLLTFPQGDLVRLRLDGGAPAVETVLGAPQLPHLSSARNIEARLLVGTGPVFLLSESDNGWIPPGARSTLLRDADNDGVLDPGPTTMTTVEWKDAGLDVPTLWKRYWDTGVDFDW